MDSVLVEIQKLLSNEPIRHFCLGIAGAFCFQAYGYIYRSPAPLPLHKAVLSIFVAGIITLVVGTQIERWIEAGEDSLGIIGKEVVLFIFGMYWPNIIQKVKGLIDAFSVAMEKTIVERSSISSDNPTDSN